MNTHTENHAVDVMPILRNSDPELSTAISDELHRQRNNIELIASENFTYPEVMEAQGTWLTNKYAEGLPNKRYYGGCEHVDVVEQLAIDRAKQLFGADHANVQPHSGAQANVAVFTAFLQPGDKIMGMNLSHGGHLTHGSPVNFSGLFYNICDYGVDADTLRIDYDALAEKALTEKPKLIIGGASAYPRIIDFERMAEIAKSVGAYFMVDMAHIAGLVAAGLHPSPVPHADFVTSTTHKTLRGPRSGMILCKEEHAKAINKSVFPGNQGGPLMHVIAGKAAGFKKALQPDFKAYQAQVVKNAARLGDALAGHGFSLCSGGTDNHLLLVDLQNKKITGKVAQIALDEAGITANRNSIPFDPESPFVTSGLRLGTPAITARGMQAADMDQIAAFINEAVTNSESPSALASIKEQVQALNAKFPLYPHLKP